MRPACRRTKTVEGKSSHAFAHPRRRARPMRKTRLRCCLRSFRSSQLYNFVAQIACTFPVAASRLFKKGTLDLERTINSSCEQEFELGVRRHAVKGGKISWLQSRFYCQERIQPCRTAPPAPENCGRSCCGAATTANRASFFKCGWPRSRLRSLRIGP